MNKAVAFTEEQLEKIGKSFVKMKKMRFLLFRIVVQLFLVMISVGFVAGSWNLNSYGFPFMYVILFTIGALLPVPVSILLGKREFGRIIQPIAIEEKVITKVITRNKWWTAIQIIIIAGIVALVLSLYALFAIYQPKDNTPPEIQKSENAKAMAVIALLLLGCFGFVPVGIFVGWMFVDPLQRAKTMRMMFKRNYGIVNFVSKGGKILSKVKNFDKDLIWVDDGVWELMPDRVMRQAKTDDPTEMEESYPITEKHIQSMIGIPTIYLDMSTMKPLTFFKEDGAANPIDLGSTLKGYVMNQLAKNMFFKKTFTILSIITIVMTFLTLYYAYTINQNMEELKALKPMIAHIEAMLQQGQVAPTTITQGGG